MSLHDYILMNSLAARCVSARGTPIDIPIAARASKAISSTKYFLYLGFLKKWSHCFKISVESCIWFTLLFFRTFNFFYILHFCHYLFRCPRSFINWWWYAEWTKLFCSHWKSCLDRSDGSILERSINISFLFHTSNFVSHLIVLTYISKNWFSSWNIYFEVFSRCWHFVFCCQRINQPNE